MTDALEVVERALLERLTTTSRRPFVLGLCGAQGSGKSTLAARLERRLNAEGISCVTLSLDDLYKTRTARRQMARDVHPLFATRGPPGTHDLELGFALIEAIEHHQAGRIPRFDKARDDRYPAANCDIAPAGTQVLLLEGWFVGARPQPPEALARPVNALERDEDPTGIWRSYANAALGGEYQRLFARIDLLVLLAAPDFAVVRGWRTEQERTLRTQRNAGMDEVEIGRFVEHYERLTRHILADMPAYADIVIKLDATRMPRFVERQY